MLGIEKEVLNIKLVPGAIIDLKPRVGWRRAGGRARVDSAIRRLSVVGAAVGRDHRRAAGVQQGIRGQRVDRQVGAQADIDTAVCAHSRLGQLRDRDVFGRRRRRGSLDDHLRGRDELDEALVSREGAGELHQRVHGRRADGRASRLDRIAVDRDARVRAAGRVLDVPLRIVARHSVQSHDDGVDGDRRGDISRARRRDGGRRRASVRRAGVLVAGAAVAARAASSRAARSAPTRAPAAPTRAASTATARAASTSAGVGRASTADARGRRQQGCDEERSKAVLHDDSEERARRGRSLN